MCYILEYIYLSIGHLAFWDINDHTLSYKVDGQCLP